ncbi:tetratricopeptide repeat protein [Amycolatopsis sp. CA-126428]|uniref:tetratricopeptide repeat protein n=1 Tax=Amycolatopsis sp. CA-126428 TaxID=2073158 RepID=UPI0018EAED7A|nr:tetratricopeptide repeat protein [Amycolatopsis sp. CA-126428]
MKARNVALLLTAALIVYLFLLADRAFALFKTGTGVGIALGAGVLLLPVLGIWVVVVTWRNGLQVQRLSRQLDAEGALPDVADLPRRPSGRVDREAADAWFEERRAEVEADQENWRAWYKLAYAYDIAGDRRRARETMKKAIELEAAERSRAE